MALARVAVVRKGGALHSRGLGLERSHLAVAFRQGVDNETGRSVDITCNTR